MIFSEQPSVEDPFGNTMTITYTQDQKTAYPARIDYTGNGSLPPTNSVEFVLEAAPTSGPSNYVPHFEVRIDRRLKTVKVRRDGDVVRRYELACTTSPITSRSLLRSITQYGSSSNHLPSITMEWTQGADGFSSDELLAGGLPNCDDTMNFPERYRPMAADVTGDGLNDLVHFCPQNDRTVDVYVSRNLGSSFSGWNRHVTTTWTEITRAYSYKIADMDLDGKDEILYILSNPNSNPNAENIRALKIPDGGNTLEDIGRGWTAVSMFEDRYLIADVTGDKYPDIVYTMEGGTRIRVLRNDGGTFVDTGLWGTQSEASSGDGMMFSLADMNGDGMADYVYLGYQTAEETIPVHVLTSTGTAFSQDRTWGSFPVTGAFEDLWRLGDINGDGLADVVLGDLNTGVLLSTGEGFAAHEFWGVTAFADDVGFAPADLNNDGMADIVYREEGTSPVWACLSSGHYFLWCTRWGTTVQEDHAPILLSDLNGDGILDFCYWKSGGTIRVQKGKPQTPDLLAKVENGMGGSFDLTYLPSAKQTGNAKLPFTLQTLGQITTRDGNVSVVGHSYRDGAFSYTEREFRGFNRVVKTLPNQLQEVTFFHQDDVFKGLAYQQKVMHPDGRIFTRVDNTYESQTTGSGAVFPRLASSRTSNYDLSGTPLETRTTFGYDNYGNVTLRFFEGDLAVSGDERKEITEYLYDTEHWLMSRVKAKSVKNRQETEILARTAYTYSRNYPKSSRVWTKRLMDNSAGDPEWTYNYDSYGNLEKTWDPEGFLSRVDHDDTETLPAVLTNPLLHQVERTYHPLFAKVTAETDPNEETTRFAYDEYGRPSMLIRRAITRPIPPSPGPISVSERWGTRGCERS